MIGSLERRVHMLGRSQTRFGSISRSSMAAHLSLSLTTATIRNSFAVLARAYRGERERHSCIRRHLASLGPGGAEGPFVQLLAQSD